MVCKIANFDCCDSVEKQNQNTANKKIDFPVGGVTSIDDTPHLVFFSLPGRKAENHNTTGKDKTYSVFSLKPKRNMFDPWNGTSQLEGVYSTGHSAQYPVRVPRSRPNRGQHLVNERHDNSVFPQEVNKQQPKEGSGRCACFCDIETTR